MLQSVKYFEMKENGLAGWKASINYKPFMLPQVSPLNTRNAFTLMYCEESWPFNIEMTYQDISFKGFSLKNNIFIFSNSRDGVIKMPKIKGFKTIPPKVSFFFVVEPPGSTVHGVF